MKVKKTEKIRLGSNTLGI